MNYRIAGRVKNVCYVIAALLALASIMFETVKTSLLVAACVVMVAGIVVQSMFYRCPHCQKMLPTNSAMPSSCPYCQMKLK